MTWDADRCLGLEILVVAVLILVACLVAAIWDDVVTERNKRKDDE